MSYRDLRCRCCPSLNSFRVGRIIVCISPHPDLSAGAPPTPAASVTTAAVFAPEPAAAVVTPFLEAALCAPEANPVTSNGGCPGIESTALDPPTEVLSGKYGAAGSPANAPDPERDDFGATNSSSASATSKEGRAICDETTESGEFIAASGRSESLHSANAAPACNRGRIADAGFVNEPAICEIRDSVTAGKTATNFSSSDGPASISPGRIIREGRETASHVLAAARYPSSGQTFCIGCDAPAGGFFCPDCEAASSFDAELLRAWHFNPAISSQPPSPVTAETSMHSGVSAFSFIDIPEFLPRKSSLLEMS